MVRSICLLLVGLACGLVAGCRGAVVADDGVAYSAVMAPRPASRGSVARPVRFVDVAAAAGIRFRHATGAFGGKWFPETNGSGAAFFDFDSDGHPDFFLVNGRPWTEAERRAAGLAPGGGQTPTTGKLYRNRGDGTFDDVTAGSGLDVPMYGMGVAAGDYDNDGRADLYVTGIGRNYLFRNEGAGRFREVAEAAGVQDRGWSSSTAWVDYDRDGFLDLFVCHYVRWSPAADVPCEEKGVRVYCAPNLYAAEACRLFRNRGDGTFTDVSNRAGIRRGRDGNALASKALGIAVGDYDGDDWPDLAVANDTEANFLFRNNHDGTFTEQAVAAGVAYSVDGKPRSGMGIDAGDWDGQGREGVLIGNFPTEMLGLYRNEPAGLLTDVAAPVGVGKASAPYTTFGCLLVDLDNDGWQDIATANGHIDVDHEGAPPTPYAQRPLFLRSEAGRHFRPFAPFPRPVVGRGLAAADIDADGDVDLLLTANGAAPLLLRNDGGNQRRSLRVTLIGTRSNRSGIGAEVRVWLGPRVLHRRVRSGSSYLSQSELPLTIGLDGAERVDRLEVHWPSGTKDVMENVPAGQAVTIRESKP